jgi:hypothetical protein
MPLREQLTALERLVDRFQGFGVGQGGGCGGHIGDDVRAFGTVTFILSMTDLAYVKLVAVPLREQVSQVLAPMGLRLSPAKTRIN